MRLSKAQNNVISILENGEFIWTNEGEKVQAWIGDENGKKSKFINVKTALFLLNNDIIKFVDGDYRHGLFKYQLKLSEREPS